MTTPVISICIPAYSNAQGVIRSLEIISKSKIALADTLFHRSANPIEVIVSSDNPILNDTFEEICAPFPFARFYACKTNKGPVPAWNKAISLARGEIVTLLHDDDFYTDHAIEYAINAFQENPDLAIYACNAFLTSDTSDGRNPRPPVIQIKMDSDTQTGFTAQEYLLNVIKIPFLTPAPSSTFIRRSFIKQWPFYEDDYTWCPEVGGYIRIFLDNRNAFYRFEKTPLVCRTIHSGQISNATWIKGFQDYARIASKFSGEPGLENLEERVSQSQFTIWSKQLKHFVGQDKLDASSLKDAVRCMNYNCLQTPFLHSPENRKRLSDMLDLILSAQPEFPLLELVENGTHATSQQRQGKFVSIFKLALLRRHEKDIRILDTYFCDQAQKIEASQLFQTPIIIDAFGSMEFYELIRLLRLTGYHIFSGAIKGSIPLCSILPFLLDDGQIEDNTSINVINHTRSAIAFRLAVQGYKIITPWVLPIFQDKDIDFWLTIFPEARVIAPLDSATSTNSCVPEERVFINLLPDTQVIINTISKEINNNVLHLWRRAPTRKNLLELTKFKQGKQSVYDSDLLMAHPRLHKIRPSFSLRKDDILLIHSRIAADRLK